VLGGRRTVGVAALDSGRATAPPEATGAGRRSRPRVMAWVAARLEGNSPESRTRVGGLPRQGIPAGGATAAPAGQEVATAMRVALLEGTHLILSGRWIADPTAAPFLGDVARPGAREWLDGGRAFVFGDSARVHRRDPVAAEAPRGRRCGTRPHLQPERRRCGERRCGTRSQLQRECRGQTAEATGHGSRRATSLGRVSLGEAWCVLSALPPGWIVLRVLEHDSALCAPYLEFSL